MVPIRPDGHPRAWHDAHVDHLPPADHPHTPPGSVIPDNTAPAETQGQNDPVRQAAEAFAAELIRLRTSHGLSQLDLARHLGYDKSRVTHLERCTQAPTQHVARRADHILGSGETLTRLWHAYHTAHAASRRRPQRLHASASTQEGPGPDGMAAPEAPHDEDEHASASSAPAPDNTEQPGVPPGIDLRGATGVIFGNGNTQHITG